MNANVFLFVLVAIAGCYVSVGAQPPGQARWFWGGSSNKPNETIPLKNLLFINEVVDVYMRELRLIVKQYHMDPFKVPNISQPLSLVTLNMDNMRVCNLSTIKRTADVVIMDDAVTKDLFFNVSIGVDELQILSDYAIVSWMINSAGKVKGKLPGMNVGLGLHFNFDTVMLNMTSFSLHKSSEPLVLEFEDSYYMNMITSFITSWFGDMIVGLVEGPFKNQLIQIIDNINVSIQANFVKDDAEVPPAEEAGKAIMRKMGVIGTAATNA